MSPHRHEESALGSRLLGDPADSPRRRRRRMIIMLAVFLAGANVVGAVVTVVSAVWVIPGPDLLDADSYGTVNFVVLPIFVTVATAVAGTVAGVRTSAALRWASEGREPTRREQVATLATPWRLTALQMILWVSGLVVVTVLDGRIDPHAAPKVALAIAVGGSLMSAFCYLLTEFTLRPIAARALEAGDPRRVRIAGVMGRSVLSWTLGSGVPVIALMVVAVVGIVGEQPTATELEIAILAFCGFALVFGLTLLLLGGTASMAPINAVRAAMTRVAAGDNDFRLQVYDGTELGQLQSGFNAMADGLRERERIRDLFGRHVGVDVARAALNSESELGGEERDVAVLFVDLIGSTTLAATAPPTVVVDLLNRFFAVVVDEVDHHGGFVNKFEGDAALAIFGAPVAIDDHCGRALDAAVNIHRRLQSEVSECEAAVAVASGRVVAGNIGAKARFEYTVIGDPVNEAARLTELAKTLPVTVAASGDAVRDASESARAQWTLGRSVTLRGRVVPTVVAVPAS